MKTRPEAEARLLDIAAAEMGSRGGQGTHGNLHQHGAGKVEIGALSERVGAAVDAVARGKLRDRGGGELRINGVYLPEQNRASVIDRMRAERARIATKYRSEGEEEALKIKRRDDGASARRSSPKRAPRRKRPRNGRSPGHAAALRSLFPGPRFLSVPARVTGDETIIDDKTTLFLETDSPLLRALQGPPDGHP